MAQIYLDDPEAISFGTNRSTRLQYNTKDDNGEALELDFSPGTSTRVPVLTVGVDTRHIDLGMFDGVTQPMVALVDFDHDSHVGFHYTADDTAVVRMSLGGGTVRNHVIPDVASSTFALVGGTNTWTGAQTIEVAALALTVQNTTDAASNQVAIFRGGNRASPGDGDAAYISLTLDDSAGAQQEFVRLSWIAKDVTDSTKDGQFKISVVTGNTLTDMFKIDSTAAGVISTTVGTGDVIISDGSGIIVGHTAQETISIGDGGTDLVPEFQMLGTGQVDAALMLAAFSTTATAAGAPLIALVKGGNGTIGSHTVVTDGEELGNIIAYGDDGTDLESVAAQIQFEVDGTPGTGDMPGRIIFATTADGAQAATERMRINNGGAVFINDSANASMTYGLTINQGTESNEYLSLKGSDLAHGITNQTETDTVMRVKRVGGADGGVTFDGFGKSTYAIRLRGMATADNTAKTTSASAPVEIFGYKKSGSDIGDPGTDANLMTIRKGGDVRFIFDAEGSGHADVEWVAYDSYDDVALMKDFQAILTDSKCEARYQLEAMEDAGIVGQDSLHWEGDKLRAMVNFSRLAMIHHGAIGQVSDRLQAYEIELQALRQANDELRTLMAGRD